MDELEIYVSNELRDDEAIIKELDWSIAEALTLFATIDFDGDVSKGIMWPYWIVDEDRRKRTTASRDRPHVISQSTTAMILSALQTAMRLPLVRVSSGYQRARYSSELPAKCPDSLDSRVDIATKALIREWCRKPSPGAVAGDSVESPDKLHDGEQKRTTSNTFGHNDVLTLSWHLDVFDPAVPGRPEDLETNQSVHLAAKEIITRRIKAYAQAENGYQGILRIFNDDIVQDRIVSDSTYNLLRFVRCFRIVEIDLRQDSDFVSARNRAFNRFRNKLHEQLSLWEVLDSQFDPSELAYCLEGMLQLRPDAVNNALLDRVIGVLEKSQQSKPAWSTDMPITADRKGQVLYPISVEIARSILASISAFDRHNASTSFYSSAGGRALHLVKRYWRWLNTRRTTITTAQGARVTGWLSEQINAAMVIHTWETSQILDFCVAYRDQLRHYISRKLLLASRLEVLWPEKRADTWEEIVEVYEPATCNHVTPVLRDIGKQFIEPHAMGAPTRPWSMLLYGPPGTGKSDLADNIAGFLGLPLIKVSVGDFIGEGQARMENRAKHLFEVLKRQTTAVVLFDEVDQFFLDRDSDRFREQETVFQFLTPGMLTKIGDLRKAANVLFIIATNYADQIDAAIKRTGRIDRQYLLLPPDSSKRLKILGSFPAIRSHIECATDDVRARIVGASAFLGYNDLRQVAGDEWKDEEDFIRRLDLSRRNIQFFSYKARFRVPDKSRLDEVDIMDGPADELTSLIVLARDAWGKEFPTRRVTECARQFSTAIFQNLVKNARHERVFLTRLEKMEIRDLDGDH